jgi:hypothetical protein
MNTKLALIESGSILFRILDAIADATNIVLALWLLAVLVLGTKNKTLAGKAWLAALLPIALVYIIKTLDSKLNLWQRIGADYSTHSALAAALVIALCVLDKPRRAIAVAIFIVYEIFIWLLGFHTLLDIGSTLLVVMPLFWLIHSSLNKPKTATLAS